MLVELVQRGLMVCSSPQFLIYGAYFAVISGIFLLAGLCKLASRRRREQKEDRGTDSPPVSDLSCST